MRHVYAFLLCSLIFATSAPAQTPSPSDQASPQTAKPTDYQSQHLGLIEGTVDSISGQTMVVKTDDNQYHLFVFETGLARPNGLTKGMRVRVASNASDEPGLRIATGVAIQETGPNGTYSDISAPPKEMVAMQREIEKQARRWRIGFKIGAGLDPELFLFGLQSDIGPIFSRDFYFRPSAEFAFGELTDMVAINLEGAYRLPVTFREGRWSSYVGAGAGLNFIHQGIGRSDISFSNFEYQTGMNVFTGVKFRRGTFAEVKTSLWARGVPTLRLAFGYTF
jgi:hypothetical protein